MAAANLAEPICGPSSTTLGSGFTDRIRLAVSVWSDPLPSLASCGLNPFEGVPIPNFCGERRNSGLEA